MTSPVGKSTAPPPRALLIEVEEAIFDVHTLNRYIEQSCDAFLRDLSTRKSGESEDQLYTLWAEAELILGNGYKSVQEMKSLTIAEVLQTVKEYVTDSLSKEMISCEALSTVKTRMLTQGYEQRQIITTVNQKVANKLRECHRAGIALYLMGSKDKSMYQLMMRNTTQGNLDQLVRGYFDQIGDELELGYFTICSQLLTEIGSALGGVAPNQVIFVSQRADHLEAAKLAGLREMSLTAFVQDGSLTH